MTTLTEKNGPGKFMASEGNGSISRDTAILDDGDLEAGTVLGKITASGKYVQVDLAAVDGSEDAAAVLWAATDATAGDKTVAVITRLAEVNMGYLVYPTGASAGDKDTINAALATHNIIVRT